MPYNLYPFESPCLLLLQHICFLTAFAALDVVVVVVLAPIVGFSGWVFLKVKVSGMDRIK